MTFATEWDRRYQEGTHLSVWPWSDLVRLAKRYVPEPDGKKVLELGFGAGANVPFLTGLGLQYWGIEGSATAANALTGPGVQAAICGDFTTDIPTGAPFDLIVDRSSVTHNETDSIKNALRLAHDALVPGGLYIGVDWWSTEHDAHKYGTVLDGLTRTDYTCGPFADVGPVHFANEAHLRGLFADFEILHLEHKVRDTIEPKPERVAAWDIVARRP